MIVCSAFDKSIAETKPFSLIKTEPEKAKEFVAILLSHINFISELLEPFMPTTSATIKQLVKENKMPETPLFARK
jgi:methionyl-tRNA synthetase